MIPAAGLRFVDDPPPDAPDEAAGEEPQVFVRTVVAPPGWAWEQRRNVDLEARYGAPLPIAELLYRVRRLEPWRPGAASRFAVFYVLAREVKGQLEASAEVDGRRLEVTFGTGAEGRGRVGLAGLRALGIGACLVLVVWAAVAALERRSETSAALQLAEQRAASKLKSAEARDRVREQGRLLELQLDRGVRMADVAADLAWASNAKTPESRLEALHWDHGLLALEVRGEAAPFGPLADRRIERSRRPIRPGVWLWGVTPGRGAGGREP
jgi:hypothetical protein